jgi:hypothetical protein
MSVSLLLVHMFYQVAFLGENGKMSSGFTTMTIADAL